MITKAMEWDIRDKGMVLPIKPCRACTFAVPIQQTRPGPSINRVIGELEIAKKFANKRADYIKGLIQYLRLFSRGRSDQSISLFTVSTIEEWFAGRKEALTTRASNIGRLSSLFSFAVRRGYLKENPCDQLEKITIDRPAPAVLSPEQVKSALDFALTEPPRFLVWFVLAGIIGIRPGELRKMGATQLIKNLTEGLVIIDAIISKVRNRRIIELTPHAQQWLEFALSEQIQLPLSKGFMRKCRAKLKRHLRLQKWPQDILRHTALSYLLAYHGDEARVALESGNSVKIFRQHYKGLITPKQSDLFHQLLPRGDSPQMELFPLPHRNGDLSIDRRVEAGSVAT